MRLARVLGFGLLYGVIALGANPVIASDLDKHDQRVLKDLREGDMRKLAIHREARPRNPESFQDQYGNTVELADFEGKVVVLNFWATWCPPCRAEMPSIDRLAGAMGGDDLAVVTLSTDRFDIDRVAGFFDEIGIKNLTVYQDRTGAVSRKTGVLGLPVTVILDRQGREIARMQGEAEWDSPNAKAILTRMIEMTAPEA